MKIITISAKARHGKDFCANIIKEQLEKEGHKVLIVHYADLLKYIMKTFFNWDGKKDDYGRTLLQHVGTEVIRRQNPNYWVDFIIGILKMFPEEWNYVIIPDTRFPNENDELKNHGFNVVALRVVRPHFDNGLTESQKQHESEIALDNYNFDYKIINNGDEAIFQEIVKFVEWTKQKGELN